MRFVVGITGASGIVYGVRLLERAAQLDIQTYLVITKAAEVTIQEESPKSVEEIKNLATTCYSPEDFTAPIASGTFPVDGIVIIPCSMKTLAGIASGFSLNLVLRAADIALKERRTLVVVPRETPLNIIHLSNMLKLVQAGAIIFPPVPAFYIKPKSVEDLVDHTVGRVLSCLGVKNNVYQRWRNNL